MTGDRGVAELAGQRGVRKVARTPLQIARLDARNDDVVDADARDLDAGECVAVLQRRQVLLLDGNHCLGRWWGLDRRGDHRVVGRVGGVAARLV